MHPCLSVAEIVERIITHVAYNKNTRRHQAPAALARTCKAWYEPVCNIVWLQLDSFEPLLCLFVTKRSDVSWTGPVPLEEFTQASNIASWARFSHHARRVRKLVCTWSWHDIAYLKVLHKFKPNADTSVLPGLQYLTYIFDQRNPDNLFPLQALTHPGLRSLRILCHNTRANLPSFEFLKDRMPALRNLDIRYDTYLDRIVDSAFSISCLLPNFEHLTHVNFNAVPLPPVTLLHLGRLSHLRSLSIFINHESISLLSSEQGDLFPSLRRLWLISCAAADVIQLLCVVSSPKFGTLDLNTQDQPMSVHVKTWAEWLAERRYFYAFSMSGVNLHYEDLLARLLGHGTFVPILLTPYLLDDDALRPLLRCRYIKSFIIRNLPVKVTNSLIHDMAISWTHLQELVLGIGVRARTSGLTLEGLLPLSVHSSNLRILAVEVDMSPAPGVTPERKRRSWLSISSLRQSEQLFARSGSGMEPVQSSFSTLAPSVTGGDGCRGQAQCKQLTNIEIGTSAIDNPVYVARFVSRHFPYVRSLSDGFTFWDTRKSLKKVNRLLVESRKQRGISNGAHHPVYQAKIYPCCLGRSPYDEFLLF